MPKQVVSRARILSAALDLLREQGFDSLNARSLAARAGCSVQPIYSCYASMDELKDALYGKAMEYYGQFISERTDAACSLESMARANVAFARLETRLFRFLFLTKLEGLNSFSDIYDRMGDRLAAQALAEKLGMTAEKVKQIYIMMIVFTHGVATMLATGGANIADAEVADCLDRAYAAFVLLQK